MVSAVLYNAMKQQISALKENRFQDFVDKLYTIYYGDKYIPIKPKNDKGCDGIIDNRKIIACYGPENYALRDYQQKIKVDYKKYKENWKTNYPQWQFIHNKENTANVVQAVKKLKPDAEIIGMRQILDDIIVHLRYSQIREILNFLQVDESYCSYDIFEEIIEDLIKERGKPTTSTIQYEKPSYIEDKIKLNYSPKDIDNAIVEYDASLHYFPILESILKENQDYLPFLKSKITRDFSKYDNGFKQRLNYLTEEYSKKYEHDEIYKNHVRAALIYFFEQCIIGKRTEREKK